MRRLRIAGLALLVTTLLIILGPFLVPVPPLPCTPSAERLAGPNGTFVRIDDLDLYAEIAGQGAPALVLLHGFAASAYSFSDVLPALAQRSLVVAYDRPAFGLSSRPLWPYRDMENPYTPEAQADQAVALMDALGIDRAVLVGHSAGGGLAVLVALRHPERVQALVLVAPAVRVNDTPDWLRLVLRTPQARYLAPLAARALPLNAPLLLRIAFHDLRAVTPDKIEGYSRPFRFCGWDRALAELVISGSPPYLGDVIGGLDVPILLITGDDDHIVPTADTLRLARDLPHAEIVVVPECGHIPHEEHPDVFLRAVTDFLDRLE